MNFRRARLACLLALALAWTLPAAAAPAVGDAIRASAEQAVLQRFALPGNTVSVHAEALTGRIDLPPCALPLKASLPPQDRPQPVLNISVRCPAPGGWSARARVELKVLREVLVTTRALQRGDGIQPSDIRAEARDITRLGYGYLDALEQTGGRSLARALPAGAVLTPGALGARRMVRAGDRVQVVARLDGIEVRASGVALGSGDNGARVRVRNEQSGKVLDAMISAPGVVMALP